MMHSPPQAPRRSVRQRHDGRNGSQVPTEEQERIRKLQAAFNFRIATKELAANV